MSLSHLLRLQAGRSAVVSLTGAGGKTGTLFQLARELSVHQRVIVTTTTHLGAWQAHLADTHLIAQRPEELLLPEKGVVLVTGENQGDRSGAVPESILNYLCETSRVSASPLLIEADGARQKPLKAPARHEPAIISSTGLVIHLAGLSALGAPLTEQNVQRSQIFSTLSGLNCGKPISPEAVINVLRHPQGGLKNIPAGARRVVFLNQADTPVLESLGGEMSTALLEVFDAVLVGSLQKSSFQLFEHRAGIILAAGKSSRFGSPKPLLPWHGKPFIRQVAETALRAGLSPVVVVTGAHAAQVESALGGLPITLAYNPDFQEGQSTSIKVGLAALPQNTGSAVFLLADQPQIPQQVLQALCEAHGRNRSAIVAPLVLEERRANPVLFDRDTFPDLMQIQGDMGGRAIFSKHRVEYLPWHDASLLLDVDRLDDYEKLKEMQ